MTQYIYNILTYLVLTIPFMFLLYYVIKKAIKDGLYEYDKENKNRIK